MSIEIVFSEFGRSRQNNNKLTFSEIGRLDPTYSSVKQYFPEDKLTCYTDCPEIGEAYSDGEIIEVDGG